jgi:hypothetical protein
MAKGDLTTKQRAAIAALITGATYIEAAAAARVHPNRITFWMREPDFLFGLREVENEKIQAINRSLITLASKAGGALEEVLDNPDALDSSKIRAADTILGRLLTYRELVDLEARIAKLEEAQNDKA